MPHQLKPSRQGRDFPIIGELFNGRPNQLPAGAQPSHPTVIGSLFNPATKQRQWAWWEWLLLPVALVVSAYQIAWSKGLFKFFAVFMVIWAVFGAGAVNFDTKADSGEMPGWIEVSYERDEYFGPYRPDCLFQGSVTRYAGWPLGKLYLTGSTCAAYIPHQLALNLGLESLADRINPLLGEVYTDYWLHGNWSLSYLWLGVIFFWTMVTLPIWLILLIGKALLGNLRISWGD